MSEVKTTESLEKKKGKRPQRSNPDFQYTVYKMDIVVNEKDIPQEVWNTGRIMQDLWNNLVDVFDWQEGQLGLDVNKNSEGKVDKTVRSEINKEYKTRFNEVLVSYRDKLDLYSIEQVKNRFETTIDNFTDARIKGRKNFKGNITPGPPSKKFGLNELRFLWRSKNNGRPLKEFFMPSLTREGVRPVFIHNKNISEDCYYDSNNDILNPDQLDAEGFIPFNVKGIFKIGINSAPLTFNALVYRPLPRIRLKHKYNFNDTDWRNQYNYYLNLNPKLKNEDNLSDEAFQKWKAEQENTVSDKDLKLKIWNGGIKEVALIGVLKRPFGWKWTINITFELPPDHEYINIYKRKQTGRIAAVDLGWRDMGNYYRLAVVADNFGNFYELKLPSELDTKSRRWFADKVSKQSSDEFSTLNFMPLSQNSRREVQTKLDDAKNQLKKKVVDQIHTLPEHIRPDLKYWEEAGNKRIGKLLRDIKDYEKETYGLIALRDDIEEYFKSNTEIYTRVLRNIDQTRQRSLEWYYGNIAAWLGDNFDKVIWEGDLNLKGMAEQVDKSPIIKAAAKNRQWVSLSLLRNKIKNSLSKRGRELVDHPCAYTSQTCSICGEKIMKSSDIILYCCNGHSVERDRNSSSFMLKQYTEMKEGTPAPIAENFKRIIARTSSGVEIAVGSRAAKA